MEGRKLIIEKKDERGQYQNVYYYMNLAYQSEKLVDRKKRNTIKLKDT